nr:immunoglobulin heavy chain junction region [Macaca mulatta]
CARVLSWPFFDYW